jgi:hypothetical protein
MWPPLRTQPWFSKQIAARVSHVATNPATWALLLLLNFLYVTGPTLYQRATATHTAVATNPPLAPPDAANPVNPSASPSTTEAPRFYSTAEKEELANRIASIYQIMNSEMLELSEQWNVAHSHSLDSKSDAEQFLKEIDALRTRMLDAHKRLWQDSVNGNPNFSGELRKLVAEDPAFLKLEIAIRNFRDGVALYSQTYDYLTPILRAQFVQVLRPFQGALFETADDFKKWTYQTNDRIAERRKSL